MSGVGTRQELHNAHVDSALALAGRCGNLHLPTGARCRRTARHSGGCDFVPEPGGPPPPRAAGGDPGTHITRPATERKA
jgi:hypothetical protein